jgi:hypothetical protein
LFDTTEGKFPDSDSTGTIIAEISSLMPMIKEGVSNLDVPNV